MALAARVKRTISKLRVSFTYTQATVTVNVVQSWRWIAFLASPREQPKTHLPPWRLLRESSKIRACSTVSSQSKPTIISPWKWMTNNNCILEVLQWLQRVSLSVIRSSNVCLQKLISLSKKCSFATFFAMRSLSRTKAGSGRVIMIWDYQYPPNREKEKRGDSRHTIVFPPLARPFGRRGLFASLFKFTNYLSLFIKYIKSKGSIN